MAFSLMGAMGIIPYEERSLPLPVARSENKFLAIIPY